MPLAARRYWQAAQDDISEVWVSLSQSRIN